ncbi:hypothetical protein BDZ89DRAFT_1146968 [Hymenopellis radicata]|nr:hypothetical protein BDZ89DRAFT_1146968 [Hymenopellis radicata]
MDTGTGTSPSPLDLLGPLDSTLGAAFIGVVIAGTFFGITSIQVFLYHTRLSNRDGSAFKGLIYFLWAMDTLHLALITHGCYFLHGNKLLQSCRTSPTYMELHGPSLRLVIVCTMIIILSLISFSCGFAFAIQSLTAANLDFSNADKNSVTLYVSFGGEVLADISIASTLCTVLYKSRTSFSSTKNVVNSLIVYAINTCVLTTVCAVACFITFAIWPDEFIYIAIYFSLNKLYFNSLLANLNSREHLRQKFNTEPISMSSLSKQPKRPSDAEPVNTEIIFAAKNTNVSGSSPSYAPASVFEVGLVV